MCKTPIKTNGITYLLSEPPEQKYTNNVWRLPRSVSMDSDFGTAKAISIKILSESFVHVYDEHLQCHHLKTTPSPLKM